VTDYGNRDLVTRTWHVRHAQAAEIAQIADGLGCGYSVLVRFLLDYALAELRAERLTLRTRPVRWELLDYQPRNE
jgi:hypothetical protein